MANFNFNVGDAPADDFDLLPAGKYSAEITESEVRPSSKGADMLALTLQVTEGEFKGRLLWDYLVHKHPKEQVRKIAERQIAAIMRACGKETIEDSSELHGIPMTVTVKVEQPKEGGQYDEPSNRIKKYAPLGAGGGGGFSSQF